MSIANWGYTQCAMLALQGYSPPCKQKMLTSSGRVHSLHVACRFIASCGKLSKIPVLFAVYAETANEFKALLKTSLAKSERIFAAQIIDKEHQRKHLLNVSLHKVLESKRAVIFQVDTQQQSQDYSLDAADEDLTFFLEGDLE